MAANLGAVMGHDRQGMPGTGASEFHDVLAAARGDTLITRLAELFDRQSKRIDALEADLRLLSLHEAHRSPILDAQPGVARAPRSLSPLYRVTAEDYLLERDGFQGIEFTADNRPYRWAGASGALPFEFYANRALPLVITMDLLDLPGQIGLGDLRLTDDEIILPLHIEESETGLSLTALLPPRDHLGVTRLIYHLPQAGGLAILGLPEGDPMPAGFGGGAIAFHGLRVTMADRDDLDRLDCGLMIPPHQVAAE